MAQARQEVPAQMQKDIHLLVLHLLEYRRKHGDQGIEPLIVGWDWAGIVGGFDLSTILPDPRMLDSAMLARGQAYANKDAAARAELAQALRRDLMAKRYGPILNRIFNGVRYLFKLVLRICAPVFIIFDPEMVKLSFAAILGVCVFLTSLVVVVFVETSMFG